MAYYKFNHYFSGVQLWSKDGKFHCVDGPAIVRLSGAQFWYQNGKYHREDGPAVIYTDGTKLWYLNDECKIVSSCLK
jgi:hypothetical protein